MAALALLGRLDGQGAPRGLGGVGPAARGLPGGDEAIVGRRGLSGPPEDDERLGPAEERRVVLGQQLERGIVRGKGFRGLAEPEEHAAERRARDGTVAGHGDRRPVRRGGVVEAPLEHRHVAGPERLLVPLEQRLGHPRRSRKEDGRPVRGRPSNGLSPGTRSARCVSASCTAAPCGPA